MAEHRDTPSTRLTEEHSFEFHRTGGSVEPADPEQLARQMEGADDLAPLGTGPLVRRSLGNAAICV